MVRAEKVVLALILMGLSRLVHAQTLGPRFDTETTPILNQAKSQAPAMKSPAAKLVTQEAKTLFEGDWIFKADPKFYLRITRDKGILHVETNIRRQVRGVIYYFVFNDVPVNPEDDKRVEVDGTHVAIISKARRCDFPITYAILIEDANTMYVEYWGYRIRREDCSYEGWDKIWDQRLTKSKL